MDDGEDIKHKNVENVENVESEGEDDILDRFEFEADQSAILFVDENSIYRNTIPDSSDDEDDGLLFRNLKPRINSVEYMISLGKSFSSGVEFKETILEYALRSGRNVRQDRWDKTKLGFKCGMSNCGWRVYCSFDEPRQIWLVKSTCSNHECTPNGKCDMLKSPVIARLFMDKLRMEPDFMPEEIQKDIKNNWKFVSSRGQYQRGRILTLDWIQKEYKDQFAHIRGYAKEIMDSNPGSTVIVDTIPNAVGEDVFNRFYVCFDILRSTWRGSFRPIIGVDGTFLKVAVKGILLTAVGHDANNQIYPIAWAVVQAENTDNWNWFIRQLKSDLGLDDGNGFVILSDRSKGLISAVKSELPRVEHRMCVKHIVENLKKKHSKKELMKPLIWHLAWSYNQTEWEENLQKIREYNMVLYDDVMKEDPKSWSRAFYKPDSCCEDVHNNATESFNSTITKARAKAMIPMLETIRRQAMQRIAKRNKKSRRRQVRISTFASDILELEKKDAERCTTYTATHGLFEVVIDGTSYRVNIVKNTCSCGKWQHSGIPCEHAYGAMIDGGLNVEDFVSGFFSTDIWQSNYETSIRPLRGPRFWMKSGLPLVVAPPKPILPGRKKGKRKFPRVKGKNESPKKKKKMTETLSRAGRIMHCSSCGEAGHNAKGCKKHRKKENQSQEMIVLTQPLQSSLDVGY